MLMLLMQLADADAEPAHLPTPAHRDNSQLKGDDLAEILITLIDVFVLKCNEKIYKNLLGFRLSSGLCELEHSMSCQ